MLRFNPTALINQDFDILHLDQGMTLSPFDIQIRGWMFLKELTHCFWFDFATTCISHRPQHKISWAPDATG